MATYLVRVVLPDRPGALGAVASRIGSVRGDVVGVEIVERIAGAAVDEFVVELPDDSSLPLLLAEVAEVDGARVDEVHPLTRGDGDRRVDAYDGATALISARSHHDVLAVLIDVVAKELQSSWTAVVDAAEPVVVASAGRPPATQWLAARVTRPVGADDLALGADVAWAPLAAWDLFLTAGRPGWRFGVHERQRLDALARLADARWTDLAESGARTAHPSTLV